MVKPLVTAILLLALLTCSVQADYQAGFDAYQQGNFEKAYSEWIKVAVSNEGEAHPAERAESLYALGMLYWLGQGVQQDTAASAVWLQEAAELDHPGAQSKLGYLYLTGEGVPHNDFEALKWLQMAAFKNDADAQYNLGVMYRDGLGADPDTEESMYWFKQAAANGDAISARIVNDGVFADSSFDQSAAPEAGDASTLANEPAVAEVADVTSHTSAPLPQVSSPFEQELETAAQEAGRSPLADDQAQDDPMAAEIQQAFGENWIRERNPENYTIQIIALQQQDKLHQFIGQHPDMAPFAIYQSQWQGKPLYVLIQGDYVNLVDAREAARTFPPGLQKNEELWIRRFMMVQGALK